MLAAALWECGTIAVVASVLLCDERAPVPEDMCVTVGACTCEGTCG